MFEKDREMARLEVGRITSFNVPNPEAAMDNIFEELIRRQKVCTHTYDDGTDALEVTKADKRKCRICGKVF